MHIKYGKWSSQSQSSSSSPYALQAVISHCSTKTLAIMNELKPMLCLVLNSVPPFGNYVCVFLHNNIHDNQTSWVFNVDDLYLSNSSLMIGPIMNLAWMIWHDELIANHKVMKLIPTVLLAYSFSTCCTCAVHVQQCAVMHTHNMHVHIKCVSN